ncbi:MAG: hypothetical protein GEV08_25795 [Acidimicrobiia bacterium]|nr:hypothetical protein [Acidimicrobiia bacterium]
MLWGDAAVRPAGRLSSATGHVDELFDRLQACLEEAEAALAPAGPTTAPALGAFLARRASLSPREREVLDLVAEGMRVPDVAERLFVSRSTVRNHLSQLFRKLGVSSQPGLLELVRAVGWRPDEEPAPAQPDRTGHGAARARPDGGAPGTGDARPGRGPAR